MGYFGYSFISLTPLQVADRRDQLDLHAFAAQASLGLILLSVQAVSLFGWVLRRYVTGGVQSRPSSPQKKYLLEGSWQGWVGPAKKKARSVKWWLGEEVEILGARYGARWQWVGGMGWASWLGVLCIHGTRPDYMHLTKRFGIIAASQLPVHYLLTLKTPYSPLQLLLRTSHESLNAVHRVLGKIIVLLLILHASFYLNFFVRTGLIATRIKDRDVRLGMSCITIVLTLGSTAMTMVRRWNYRVFYSIHAVGGSVLLPLLFFHVTHIRPFILECAAIHILNLALRFWNTTTYPDATLTIVPGTENLIQISIPLSSSPGIRSWKAGQHVYLRSPTHSGLSYFRNNPFTISSLPASDGHLTLVARALHGNTKRLADLINSSTSISISNPDAPNSLSLPVKLEGPYGHSAHLPNLQRYDRILLVAGGVGATYILPLWRALTAQTGTDQERRLVWAVRNTADTRWALPALAGRREEPGFDRDERELYVTGAAASTSGSAPMELSDRAADHDFEDMTASAGITVHRARPDLRAIVDEVFAGNVGSVAVFVCGPPGMGRQVQKDVGRWVRRGKDVYWHAEEFGL